MKVDKVIKKSEKVVCLLFDSCQSIVRILVCCFCSVVDVGIALSYSWLSLLYNVKMTFPFYWLSYYSRTSAFVNWISPPSFALYDICIVKDSTINILLKRNTQEKPYRNTLFSLVNRLHTWILLKSLKVIYTSYANSVDDIETYQLTDNHLKYHPIYRWTHQNIYVHTWVYTVIQ